MIEVNLFNRREFQRCVTMEQPPRVGEFVQFEVARFGPRPRKVVSVIWRLDTSRSNYVDVYTT